MGRKALLMGFTGLAMALPASLRAERAAAPVNVNVSCECADTTGVAYGDAINDLLAKDSHFKRVGLEEAVRTSAIQIHIISLPLESTGGAPRAALSVVYTHEGTMMHQFITTCTHIPITECAAAMVRDLKRLELEQSASLN